MQTDHLASVSATVFIFAVAMAGLLAMAAAAVAGRGVRLGGLVGDVRSGRQPVVGGQHRPLAMTMATTMLWIGAGR